VREERDAAAKLDEQKAEAQAAATAAEKEAAGLKREQQGTAKAVLVAERKAQKQRDLLEEQAPLRVKNTEEAARAVKRLKRLEVALASAQKADAERTSTIAKLEADLDDLQAAQAAYDAERREQAEAAGDLTLGEEQLSEYNRRKEEAGAKTYKLKQERDVLEMEQKREQVKIPHNKALLSPLCALASRAAPPLSRWHADGGDGGRERACPRVLSVCRRICRATVVIRTQDQLTVRCGAAHKTPPSQSPPRHGDDDMG
jgi:hypothetical protein